MLDALRKLTANTPSEPTNGEIAAIVTAEPSTVAHILQTDRRRHTIKRLDEHGATTLSELATHIASLETGTRRPQSDPRKRVYVSLYQNHLPELQNAHVLQWEKDRGTITPGPQLAGYARAAQCLETVSGGSQR